MHGLILYMSHKSFITIKLKIKKLSMIILMKKK